MDRVKARTAAPEGGELLSGIVRALIDSGQASVPQVGASIPVTLVGNLVYCGPWTVPDASGCIGCALLWQLDVNPNSVGDPADLAATSWAAVLITALVLDAVRLGPALTRRIRVLDLVTGAIGLHSFVPHPLCARCEKVATPAVPKTAAAPPDLDTAQPAAGGQLRSRIMSRTVLRGELVDFRFGPVAHLYRDEESPLALVTSESVVPGRARREGGYGRSLRYSDSEIPAILEGIERTAGGYRSPTTGVVIGSYAELQADALDPRTLGEHEPVALARPDFAFDAFHADAQTSWVWGWSTLRGRPILVPEHVAFWHERGTGSRFVYESSNGCAVGGSFEEAALHGLFEVIERDAFLLAWYSRSRLTEIDLTGEARFEHISDRLAESDLRLRVLDLTSDLGVPTALALITASAGTVRAGLAPGLSLASGTHPDPRQAVGTALEETVTNALMYQKWVRLRPSIDVERCRPMLDDFSLVETLDDHTGMHGVPEARALWDFLDHPTAVVPFRDFAPEWCPSPPHDIASSLRAQLEHMHGLGLDVVIVDQTVDHYAATLGIHAVKVIVPGSLPMTFGHLNQRTRGLPRLERAASLLRRAVPAHAPGEIHSVPHPFP